MKILFSLSISLLLDLLLTPSRSGPILSEGEINKNGSKGVFPINPLTPILEFSLKGWRIYINFYYFLPQPPLLLLLWFLNLAR